LEQVAGFSNIQANKTNSETGKYLAKDEKNSGLNTAKKPTPLFYPSMFAMPLSGMSRARKYL